MKIEICRINRILLSKDIFVLDQTATILIPESNQVFLLHILLNSQWKIPVIHSTEQLWNAEFWKVATC